MPTQDYTGGALLDLTRATAGWSFDAAGTLTEAAAGALRQDHDPVSLAYRGLLVEGAATNLVNGGNEGAVAASPGTPPTGWSWFTSSSGMTRTIVGTGIEDGIPYVDVRWAGTPGSNLLRDMNFNANTAIAGVAGETFTALAPARIVGGATSNVVLTQFLLGRNSSSVIVENSSQVITSAVAVASLREHIGAVSRTLTAGTTAYVQSMIRFAFTTGAAADITLRIGAPSFWKSAYAFSPSLAPAGSPGAFTRNADDLAVADVTRWFDPAVGTFVIDFTPREAAAAADRGLLLLDDGTADNRVRLRMVAADTTVRLSVDVGGAPEVAALDTASGAALTRHTARLSYGPAGYLLSVNGAAPVSAAGDVPAGLARVILGRSTDAGEHLNGWLGTRVAYFPRQYTDVAGPDGFTIRDR